ncbi:MAG TPA: TA system VapC family ribonuclease toxin [Terriglobales bacterium]|nr:TA system VapC family ribonuclease toxin [Terriglobales bacterium]
MRVVRTTISIDEALMRRARQFAESRSLSCFLAHARAGWATCPITEAGFVRIVSNPAFSPGAPRAENALDLLAHNLRHPAHRFWPGSLSLEAAARVTQARLFGHRQVTDAYLLALAMHRRGRLVTLDGGVRLLLPPGSRQLGSATSRAGARCRPSKPAHKRPAGATQRKVASHSDYDRYVEQIEVA